MHLIVHPIAQLELAVALERSKMEFGQRTADRLQARIEKAGRLLMHDPKVGTRTVTGARKLPLGRYPYSLVYRVKLEVITVVALAHQSREPGYWQLRT